MRQWQKQTINALFESRGFNVFLKQTSCFQFVGSSMLFGENIAYSSETIQVQTKPSNQLLRDGWLEFDSYMFSFTSCCTCLRKWTCVRYITVNESQMYLPVRICLGICIHDLRSYMPCLCVCVSCHCEKHHLQTKLGGRTDVATAWPMRTRLTSEIPY